MSQEFRFDPQTDLALGGAAARFQGNLAALQLLKRLEANDPLVRDLTTEEQHTLACYSGWGDTDVLHHAFPNGTYSWAKPHPALEGLLTPEETSSLLASSLNAHYTSLPMIRAIYAALEHFGFTQDHQSRLLELDSQSVALGSVQQQKFR